MKKFILFLTLFTTSALAQMQGLVYHQIHCTDETGAPLDITSMYIYAPDTTTEAVIYRDKGATKQMVQPITTSSRWTTVLGSVVSWWGPDGWEYQITAGGRSIDSTQIPARDASHNQIILPNPQQITDVELIALANTTADANELPYFDSTTTADTISIFQWVIDFLADVNVVDARAELGVALGTNVQAWDDDLDDIAALTPTDSNIIVGNGTDWVKEGGGTARTSLGVAIGSDVQAWDDDLDDMAALTPTNGNFMVGDNTDWVAESGETALASLGVDANWIPMVNNTESDAERRTWKDDVNLGQVIDVRDYGADPADGANLSDDVAVQAALVVAIAAAASGEVPVLYFPAGVWDVNTLEITDQVHIQGDGATSTILDARGGDGYVIHSTTGGVYMRDFGFMGPNGGIHSYNNHFGFLENIWCGMGTGGKAYYINGGIFTELLNVDSHGGNSWQFDSSDANMPTHDFYIDESDTHPSNATSLTNCAAVGGSINGIYAENTDGLNIVNCEIEGQCTEAHIELHSMTKVRVTSSHIEAGTGDYDIDMNDCSKCSFINTSAGQGLHIYGDSYSNDFIGGEYDEVLIENTVYSTLFISCRLKGSAGGDYFADQGHYTKTIGCSWATPTASAYVLGLANYDGSEPKCLNYNGTFEIWTDSNTPAGDGYQALGLGYFTQESTIVYDGEYSLRYTCGGAPTSDMLEYTFDSNDGTFADNTMITVSCMIYRPTATDVDDMRWVVSFGSAVSFASWDANEMPANTWVKLSARFHNNGGNDAADIRLGFYAGNSGEHLYFDNFAVMRGSVAPQTTANYEGEFINNLYSRGVSQFGDDSNNVTISAKGVPNFNCETPDLTGNSYTIDDDDYHVLIDDDDAQVTGTVVVALPNEGATSRRILEIGKIGNSYNVQLDGDGADTINESTTATIVSQYDSVSIHWDGTEWWIY